MFRKCNFCRCRSVCHGRFALPLLLAIGNLSERLREAHTDEKWKRCSHEGEESAQQRHSERKFHSAAFEAFLRAPSLRFVHLCLGRFREQRLSCVGTRTLCPVRIGARASLGQTPPESFGLSVFWQRGLDEENREASLTRPVSADVPPLAGRRL